MIFFFKTKLALLSFHGQRVFLVLISIFLFNMFNKITHFQYQILAWGRQTSRTRWAARAHKPPSPGYMLAWALVTTAWSACPRGGSSSEAQHQPCELGKEQL
jgi:hypothetical protein